MAAPACPSCGNVNPIGTERCLSCGAVLPVSTRTVVCPQCKNVNPIGAVQCQRCGAALPLDYLKPQVIRESAEKGGIMSLRVAALGLLIGGILIYAFPIIVWAYYGYQPIHISVPPSATANLPPVPNGLKVSLQVVTLLGMIALGVAWLMFGRGFSMLSEVDLGYRSASVSAYVGIISVVLAGAAILLNIDGVTNYLNCVNSSGANCVSDLSSVQYTVYWLWAFSILFFIFGGIGVLVGLFRVGTRYLTSSFWIAGFLLIFPVLMLLGAIVLLFATSGADERLRSWGRKAVDVTPTVAPAAPGTPP